MTLADEKQIDQAKQLFASAVFTGQWPGDLMLLTDGLSDQNLKWFEDKGIIVKVVTPLYRDCDWQPLRDTKNADKKKKHPVIVSLKIALFKEDLKQWKTVTYLDTDMIIFGSISRLKDINGFVAGQNPNGGRLQDEFTNLSKVCSVVGKNFPARERDFCTGIFSFPTSLITPETYSELKELFDLCIDRSLFGEQGVLNLYFFRKWKALPVAFNCFVTGFLDELYPEGLEPARYYGTVLHFAAFAQKPWALTSPYHSKWKDNLALAEKLGEVLPQTAEPLSHRLLVNALPVRFAWRRYLFLPVMNLFKRVFRAIRATHKKMDGDR